MYAQSVAMFTIPRCAIRITALRQEQSLTIFPMTGYALFAEPINRHSRKNLSLIHIYLVTSAVSCMKKVCDELGGRVKNIAAIAFTGQMSGFMGVDHEWNDITTWSCSLDSRYMPYAQRQMKELKREFLQTSGTNAPQMAPKFEWFKKEFPEESKKIRKYLMISGYLIGKLSGMPVEDAVIDTTYTTWTGLADIGKGAWSERICDRIGLDTKYLPRIVSSNTICAKLSRKMAEYTGLREGVPLVSGAGDKMAGALGSGAVSPGDMIFEAGSYGEISCCVPDYRPDLQTGRIDCLPSAVPGYFFATKFVAGSGITPVSYTHLDVYKRQVITFE